MPCFVLHMFDPDAACLCLCVRADRFHWTIWMALGLTLLCVPIIIWTVENLVRVRERGRGQWRTGFWVVEEGGGGGGLRMGEQMGRGQWRLLLG